MSPLWIEEDDGTCSSPPIRVSSLSGTASRVCIVSFTPALAFIWSAAGVNCTLVCTPRAPVFPFSSNSTQEPWQHKRSRGRKEGNLARFVSANPVHRNTPLSPFKRKQLTYISCTSHSVHLNELGVLCIDDSVHCFVPLPY